MGLRLIGAGFGRTGTASLKLALEQIGYGPCYHMLEVFAHMEHVPLWVDAGKGNPDWDTIFDGYQSTVDFPGCTHWRVLMKKYPKAKVLLSTRDPGRWFDSVHETIMSPRTVEYTTQSPLFEMMKTNIYDLFDGRLNDRQYMIECYERHVQEVTSTVPKDRLLVFEAKMGWEPLCAFLNAKVPTTPYPHVNTKDDFIKMFTDENARAEVVEQMTRAARGV